jgi:hypothetical protein
MGASPTLVAPLAIRTGIDGHIPTPRVRMSLMRCVRLPGPCLSSERRQVDDGTMDRY